MRGAGMTKVEAKAYEEGDEISRSPRRGLKVPETLRSRRAATRSFQKGLRHSCAELKRSSSWVDWTGAKLLESLSMGRKRTSLAGSKAEPRLGWSCWRGRICRDLSLLASRLPLFSPQMTKPRPATHVPRHMMNIMRIVDRSPRTLSMTLRCSSLIS